MWAKRDLLGPVTRVTVAATAAAAVLLASARSTQAYHYTFWTQAANNSEYGYQPNDTMVWQQWITEGRALKWCSNFNSNDKPALQQAINDWMAAFSSSFGNEFVEGWPCDVEFTWFPDNPCSVDAAWACYAPVRTRDAARDGTYVTHAYIEFNGRRSWNYDRYRAVAAHELGHGYNLWEQYVEGTFGCYVGTTSIMDTNIPGVQWCDYPLLGPSSWDNSMAAWVYSLRPADQPSASGGSGYLNFWFGDVNYSDSHVAVHIRRWDGSQWGTLVDGWQRTYGIAAGDGDAWTPVQGWWPRSGPAGYYRACFAPWNAVLNAYPYYNCSPWVWVR